MQYSDKIEFQVSDVKTLQAVLDETQYRSEPGRPAEVNQDTFYLAFTMMLDKFVLNNDDMAQMEVIRCARDLQKAINDM